MSTDVEALVEAGVAMELTHGSLEVIDERGREVIARTFGVESPGGIGDIPVYTEVTLTAVGPVGMLMLTQLAKEIAEWLEERSGERMWLSGEIEGRGH